MFLPFVPSEVEGREPSPRLSSLRHPGLDPGSTFLTELSPRPPHFGYNRAMVTPPKNEPEMPKPADVEALDAAREVMKRRRKALEELAGNIMREDRDILRKLAE